MIDRENSLPKPRELVSHVNETEIADSHKLTVYEKAIDRAMELGIDVLDFTADLAGEIQRDLLRKT